MPPLAVSPDRIDEINRLTTLARLLSTTVHEVGNVLQVVSGSAELLLARPDDAERTRRRARLISEQSSAVGARLRGLAALATAPTDPVLLDAREIAARAVDIRSHAFECSGLAVELSPGGDGRHVLADEHSLLRILINLILNAERALAGRRDGRIDVQVRAEGETTTLAVTDNGPGVPPDVVPHLFEPFTPGPGPGCGLFVARRLAARHRGRLDYQPTGSHGATFVLTLPVG